MTRQLVSGSQGGTTYELWISTTSQTDPTSFTLLSSWDELTLNAVYNVYEEKLVDLSTHVGSAYIAFVRRHTQTGTTTSGDAWLRNNFV